MIRGRRQIEDDELALEWYGLRFRRPSTEAEFRGWFVHEAVSYARLAVAASLVGWLAAWFALGAGVPGTFNKVTPWFFAVVLPLLVIATAASFRPGWYMLILGGCVNMIAGVIAIWPISFEAADSPLLASLVLVLFAYYAFTIFRLPPSIAAPAVLTYTVVHQVLVAQAHGDGTINTRDAWIDSVIPWVAFGTGLLTCCVLMRLSRDAFRRELVIERQGEMIAAERERSDLLLRNVLPDVVAEQLKDSNEPIAEYFDEVTVLFADISGFTEMASAVPPRELVGLLNDVFSMFDSLTAARGAEKIKTIGDAYMAVAGIPTPQRDHVATMADLALDMRDSLDDIEERAGVAISCRFGLATGPAVAGVIGRHRFAYDLWGNTVNMAARMESHGEIGQIQTTTDVRDRLVETHVFTPRGTITVKGVGPTETWFLDSRKS
ncbi:MAG TPA: adenylate/guanylate cyclase domain-containing protein [Jatrophihabitantaceae bacterium]|nr:adenylate/guanylate cyclase domain-containing protein [Jatrophihabitantaceae bacterium]